MDRPLADWFNTVCPAPAWKVQKVQWHHCGISSDYTTSFRVRSKPLPRGNQDVAKILIVEDNEMNRDMLSLRLSRKGYEVVTAEYGAR